MVQITYRKKGITITQVWFAEKEKPVKSDIVFLHGIPYKMKEKHSFCTPFHTLISNLNETVEELSAKINKNVRYEIRRNCKEEVVYRVFRPSDLREQPQIVEQFGEMYECMYRAKGQNAVFHRPQFDAYIEQDAVILTAICEGETPLVFHSYIVCENQVRLLHSVSDFRSGQVDANLVARANKRLHWEDMILFKNEGKAIYDWGGVSSLEQPNGIDAFKFKFGGNPLTYYNAYVGKSLIGRMAVRFLKIRNGKK